MDQLPYRRLVAWQRAYDFAIDVLADTRSAAFRDERDLRRQLVRAVMSVPANLAEGHGRGTALDFASFVDRARGSLFETDTWLLAARDLGLLDEARHTEFQARILELNAIIRGLRDRLRDDGLRRERRS